MLYLGALRAGLVAVPVNPAYTAPEVEHLLHRLAARRCTSTPSPRAALLADAGRRRRPALATASGEELAVLLYTSGTSGRTKGAMLSARALLANLDQIAAVEPPLVTATDVLFVPLPMTHIFGLNAGLGIALRVGATLVLADRFDAGATLATMAAERVTAVLGVPGQYAAWLAASGRAATGSRPSGSRCRARRRSAAGWSTGSPPPGSPLHDGYGLTEAAPVVTINALGAGPRAPRRARSAARCPASRSSCATRDGDEVDDGDPGRIFVRGANLFSGYWPDGADGPDADGWFGTGDIAVTDDDGQLHLVGRSSDLVIVNGFNVYPAEVEAVLAAQPGVAEVAVVGGAGRATPARRSEAYVVPDRRARARPGGSCSPPPPARWPGSSCRAASTSSTPCRTPSPARS